MNLLSSALPGIRDLRAPLIAGYLWLLLVYLIVEPGRDFQNLGGTAADLVDLAHTVGPIATAAAVSVFAFFLGALSQPVAEALAGRARWPFFRVGRRLGLGVGAVPRPSVPVNAAMRAVEDEVGDVNRLTAPRFIPSRASRLASVVEELRADIAREAGSDRQRTYASDSIMATRRAADALAPAPEDADVERLMADFAAIDRGLVRAAWGQAEVGARPIRSEVERAERAYDFAPERVRPAMWGALVFRARELAVESDLQLSIPATLLVGDQELAFAEADRERAEAELRKAVALPLAALAVFLATGAVWWAVLVLAAIVLMWQGLLREDASRQLIVQTIVHKDVAFTPFVEFHEAVEAAERAAGIATVSAAPSGSLRPT